MPGGSFAEQVARMPRLIGHQRRREADAHRRPGGLREVLDHLRRVPVHSADAVGADRAHDLAAEQVRLGRLAGAARAAGRDDDDVGLDQAGRQGRGHRQGDRRRVAAGDGDPPGVGQLLPLAGQLRQAVGPGAGVLAAVPAGPGGRVVQPVVGAAVDDEGVVRELRRDGGGLAVRQRQHDDVVPGQGRRRRWAGRPGRRRASGGAGARPGVGRRSSWRAPRPGGGSGARPAAGTPHRPRTRWRR